jgi:phosphoribosylaminoimidazolecarboxamide formyltransferase/IMP cyclohydrolase
LSVAAFNRISQYDGAISDIRSGGSHAPLPASQCFVKCRFALRRELPPASRAGRVTAPARLMVTAKQLQGKELSYNNIADADAAWE